MKSRHVFSISRNSTANVERTCAGHIYRVWISHQLPRSQKEVRHQEHEGKICRFMILVWLWFTMRRVKWRPIYPRRLLGKRNIFLHLFTTSKKHKLLSAGCTGVGSRSLVLSISYVQTVYVHYIYSIYIYLSYWIHTINYVASLAAFADYYYGLQAIPENPRGLALGATVLAHTQALFVASSNHDLVRWGHDNTSCKHIDILDLDQ